MAAGFVLVGLMALLAPIAVWLWIRADKQHLLAIGALTEQSDEPKGA